MTMLRSANFFVSNPLPSLFNNGSKPVAQARNKLQGQVVTPSTHLQSNNGAKLNRLLMADVFIKNFHLTEENVSNAADVASFSMPSFPSSFSTSSSTASQQSSSHKDSRSKGSVALR